MRHAQSQALHAYWKTRRQGGAAPLRADIEPQDISGLLGHIFMLQRVDPDHHVFRLAGTEICNLYQREFREQNFLSLWRGHDRSHMQALLESCLATVSPASVIASASTFDMMELTFEVSLLPLRGRAGLVDRVLGLFQPLEDTSRLQNRPLIRTSLSEIHTPSTPKSLFSSAIPANDENQLLAANDR